MSPVFARDQLRAFVERIERIEGEIKELNDDKKDIYAEAKANGFDVKALKAVIAYRRKDPQEQEEHDAIFRLYLDTLEGKSETGTDHAIARARARPQSAAPAQSSVQPSATGQAMQASAAMARSGGDPYSDLEPPAFLDRRRAQ